MRTDQRLEKCTDLYIYVFDIGQLLYNNCRVMRILAGEVWGAFLIPPTLFKIIIRISASKKYGVSQHSDRRR